MTRLAPFLGQYFADTCSDPLAPPVMIAVFRVNLDPSLFPLSPKMNSFILV